MAVQNSIYIEMPQDFNFGECLRILARSPHECLFRVDEFTVTKWFHGDDGNCVFRLKAVPGGLEMQIITGPVSEALAHQAVVFVRRWFDADRDLLPFYKILERDAFLAQKLLPYKGLRLVGIPDLLECLSWAIIGQQINLAFAYRLKCRLVRHCGLSLKHGGSDYFAFPDAGQIIAVREEDLRNMQFSRSKIAYLKNCAEAMLAGHLDALLTPAIALQSAREILTAIKGVGRWTADYVLMKTLRHPQAYPVGDAGLQNAIKLAYQMERKPSEAELQQMAADWQGWEAYMTFYWWRSLL